MNGDTAIGTDDPRDSKQSGIDDEDLAKTNPQKDLTREDIESGNDRNVSSDQGNRSGKTNKIRDDTIEIGR